MHTRSPYNGPYRKLVLAFDVGTTFSGISYSILDPGQVPEIKGVTRFPSQEQVGGDSKIPTIIYYDQNGKDRAAGAEAIQDGIEELIADEGWTKAEWFKLHLRPKSSRSPIISHAIPDLPENKSVIDVFGDFLRYLYYCAKTYICDTHANGAALWASVERRIDFVLTHPNGWEGAQQDRMRKAAVRAGLIPDTRDGHARVQFVTEGEASLHYCIQSGLTVDAIKKGEGVMIVDAGGGTIDLSAYGQGQAEYSFQEIASPQCHFHGSIFVTDHARSFLRDLFQGSRFIEDLDHITNCFDKTTKLRFRNLNEPQYIKFGTARDKDLKLNIRSGQLKLLGTDVASFFAPSIDCIIKAIIEQREKASKPISSIFLVGGFAASDWLFSQLKDSLDSFGLNFSRPDSHVNKAVADGAISFYLDHFVSARVSKYAYGVKCSVDYNIRDAEHLRRSSLVYFGADGHAMVPSAFSIILPKETQVLETTEFREPYVRVVTSPDHFGPQVWDEIICYRGPSTKPEWTDQEREMYSTLCTVVTDTSNFRHALQRRQQANGKVYYQLSYDIILSFGLTELAAQICWKENGKERRSPAKIVYED